MLVEFRVQNFRSLRDEQVFSLVASKDKTDLDTHAFQTGLSAVPSVLLSSAIYGGNASGKSNVIKALQYMRGLVTESASGMQPGQLFQFQPFRLDTQSGEQPTTFEVTFLIDGIRYQYGFAMTASRIVSEHLLVYKAFKPQRWFTRAFDETLGKDVYEFGAGLKGPKHMWESATRSNSLFLSMAAQLNSEVLQPVFEWFSQKLVIFNEDTPLGPDASIQMLLQADRRVAVCRFLSAADISITDIDVQTDAQQRRLRFHHVTDQGQAIFELADESSGTRNLLFLAGPVFNVLDQGLTLVIDELDTSLHTLLVRELVRLFHNPAINKAHAQLVFTTHDTSLLNAPSLLRRDQVWLAEKDRNQATALIGLYEYSPRKNEALERGYLVGRYGGVPLVSQGLGLK